MVYILKKSKKSARQNKLKFTNYEAKEFLYGLTKKDFVIDEYLLFSSDDYEETESVLNYFSTVFLTKVVYESFDVYQVNETIKKSDRLANNGINISSIRNFKKKLEDLIEDSDVSVTLGHDTFEILVVHFTGNIKVICNYQLDIVESYASNHEGKYVNIEKTDAMVKAINKLFTKQRYYYKNKDL